MRKVTLNRLRNMSNRVFLLLFVICLIVICVYIFIAKPFGEDKIVDVFSLVGTIIGAIFIAVELQNTQVVTCCETLINLNNYFHENDTLMKVYGLLERNYITQFADKGLETDTSENDIAAYCTFFENLYLLINNRIAKISDIDDLFGYRFFIFINNPYIQEHYILPTSSSYRQIFALYDIWIDYRKKSKGLSHIPNEKFSFSDEYLNKKLYFFDKEPDLKHYSDVTTRSGEVINLRELDFHDLTAILNLQEVVYESLPDKTILAPLTREELIESLHLDSLIGTFNGKNELVAFTLLITNRKGKRNLASDANLDWRKCATLDMVMVHPSYRGNHLQQTLINTIVDNSCHEPIQYILATVAPDNTHSLENFKKMGFAVAVSKLSKYGGLQRTLLLKQK